MMVAMVAILEVFNCYLLPNSKSDGVETWWKASGQHGDLEMLKWFRSDIQDGNNGSHLEDLHITFCSQWEALECYRNSELLKSFFSNIQYGCHLEFFQTTSPPKQLVRLSQKLDGRHQGDMEIQNC